MILTLLEKSDFKRVFKTAFYKVGPNTEPCGQLLVHFFSIIIREFSDKYCTFLSET